MGYNPLWNPKVEHQLNTIGKSVPWTGYTRPRMSLEYTNGILAPRAWSEKNGVHQKWRLSLSQKPEALVKFATCFLIYRKILKHIWVIVSNDTKPKPQKRDNWLPFMLTMTLRWHHCFEDSWMCPSITTIIRLAWKVSSECHHEIWTIILKHPRHPNTSWEGIWMSWNNLHLSGKCAVQFGSFGNIRIFPTCLKTSRFRNPANHLGWC